MFITEEEFRSKCMHVHLRISIPNHLYKRYGILMLRLNGYRWPFFRHSFFLFSYRNRWKIPAPFCLYHPP